MKKIILISILSILLFSCSNNNVEKNWENKKIEIKNNQNLTENKKEKNNSWIVESNSWNTETNSWELNKIEKKQEINKKANTKKNDQKTSSWVDIKAQQESVDEIEDFANDLFNMIENETK